MNYPSQDSPIYNGLPWTIFPMAGAKSGYRSVSDTTPGGYLVEQIDQSRWRGRYGYEKSPGRPNVEIGAFTDAALAILACERHDFAFWSSTRKRGAVAPRFGGSEHVRNYVQSLDASDRDRLLPLILGDHVMSDGVSFSERASFMDVTKGSLRQDKDGSLLLTLSIPASKMPLWLMEKKSGGQVCIGIADGEDPMTEEWRERGARAMRRIFALESDNSFQHWLAVRYDRWSMVRSAIEINSDAVKEAVGETMLRLCGCPSHKHLSFNRDAIMRFERYEAEFYADTARLAETP